MKFDVIAFKNCYPTTKITSEKQFKEDIKYYQMIKENLKKYHGKQFILVTPPPERKELTTLENAKRAKKLVGWLCSKEFSKGILNVHIFDLFSLLADSNGFLKEEYTRLIPVDSHPNIKANVHIAPIFAQKIVEVVYKT